MVSRATREPSQQRTSPSTPTPPPPFTCITDRRATAGTRATRGSALPTWTPPRLAPTCLPAARGLLWFLLLVCLLLSWCYFAFLVIISDLRSPLVRFQICDIILLWFEDLHDIMRQMAFISVFLFYSLNICANIFIQYSYLTVILIKTINLYTYGVKLFTKDFVFKLITFLKYSWLKLLQGSS